MTTCRWNSQRPSVHTSLFTSTKLLNLRNWLAIDLNKRWPEGLKSEENSFLDVFAEDRRMYAKSCRPLSKCLVIYCIFALFQFQHTRKISSTVDSHPLKPPLIDTDRRQLVNTWNLHRSQHKYANYLYYLKLLGKVSASGEFYEVNHFRGTNSFAHLTY